ncbi:hypothetical protein [Chryseobacterium foetidum]|uniref:hypothetical protein n=1 Tax=Chryseobacterium foetidum TaxID=2951057 RepID=UPI0021CA0F6E|nr:hypothetical protein [Chryseobacterium foetidum]
MKSKFLGLLAVSFVLATFGFIADGDRLEPSMMMRFTEFFGMTAILFLLTSMVYFPSSYALKYIRKN